jgi:hypothetical protein
MAAGDIVFFHQFKVDLGNKLHDLDTDTWKVGLTTATVTPTAADAGPHWGGTGTTNYATNQVTPGGNYATGGPSLTSLAYTNSAGTVSWNAAKVAIAQNASNPTNARWGIIYNSTDANKRAAAYIDLGSARDLTTGLFEIRFNSVDGTGTIGTLA